MTIISGDSKRFMKRIPNNYLDGKKEKEYDKKQIRKFHIVLYFSLIQSGGDT